MLDPAIHAQLASVLPASALLTTAEETKPYECDGLTMYRELPAAVAIPDDEAQLVEVLRRCHAAGVPVVARGAGTSLSGGALPDKRGVLVAMAKFRRIVAIDPLAQTAVVQPGVTNLAISAAAAPYGLYYAPDPSSQIACTIGGNVGENAGGVHCLKYGLTVHNVRRVRGVLITGEAVEFGGEALDSAGYDLLALVHGSEGLLAVTTEITVKLTPRPVMAQVALAAFADVGAAGAAVAAVIGAGIVPAGLEMMDRSATRAVEEFVHAGYPLDAAAVLLVETDGTPEEVAADMAEITRVLGAAGATGIRVSKDERERLLLWSGRKAAFPAIGRITPDYYCMDGTIPRKALAAVLLRIEALSEQYKLRCANVFHAGDGNLHPLIMYDANVADESKRAEAFGADDPGALHRGGRHDHRRARRRRREAAADVRAVPAGRARVLPRGQGGVRRQDLLNPGKGVPTLSRCAEFGKMHVHHGKLPHPELPRF